MLDAIVRMLAGADFSPGTRYRLRTSNIGAWPNTEGWDMDRRG